MATPNTRMTLLERVRNGDQPSITEFYNLYKGLIKAVAISVVGSRAPSCRLSAAELADLEIEVMASIFRDGKFSYDSNKGARFRTWFGKVVKNKLADLMRAKYRQAREVRGADCGVNTSNDVDIPIEVFTPHWDAEWRQHLVREALSLLRIQVKPVTYRTFVMVAIDDGCL